MKNHPLVSFLIAAYNEEKYIIECIESCLNQTYPNIEVCVTDDGSIDSTWNLLESKYKNNPKVKLYKFEANKGKVRAFNNSYAMSSGEYFALIGADDVNYLNRIDLSYDFILESNCNLIFGQLDSCNENLESLNLEYRVNRNNFRVDKILQGNIVSGTTVFFDKNLAENAFPIPVYLKFEDWWLGFIAISRGKIGFLYKNLTKYRYNGNNQFSFFYIDIHSKVDVLKKDFTRHFAYYDEFVKYINNHLEFYQDSKKLFKIINLSVLYRQIFLEDKFCKRVFYLGKVLQNLSFSIYFMRILGLILFGNYLTLKINEILKKQILYFRKKSRG